MEYNALIRGGYSGKSQSLEILARVLVADLKDFPADWTIRYKSREVNRETINVSDLCCFPVNPLQIYQPKNDSFPITVRKTDGSSLNVMFSARYTGKILKRKIAQRDDMCPPKVQELLFKKGNQLEELPNWTSLSHLLLCNRSTVFLQIDLNSLDIENTRVKLPPIDLTPRFSSNGHAHKWALCADGLNSSGPCSNSNCISKQKAGAAEVVTRLVSYGELQLQFPARKNQFKCPACSQEYSMSSNDVLVDLEDGSFQIAPKEFFLSNARSLIFYKSAEDGTVVRKFSQHKQKSSNKFNKILYTYGKKFKIVEFTTVEPWKSPYNCVRCDTRIMYKVEEFKMKCGHMYHFRCTWKNFKDCDVCSTPFLKIDEINFNLSI